MALDPIGIKAIQAEIAQAKRDALEEAAQREMPPQFLGWMKRQMPKGTVIGDPEWWAGRIWRAAIRADRDAWPNHQAKGMKEQGND
jgi:hypothetical protein